MERRELTVLFSQLKNRKKLRQNLDSFPCILLVEAGAVFGSAYPICQKYIGMYFYNRAVPVLRKMRVEVGGLGKI